MAGGRPTASRRGRGRYRQAAFAADLPQVARGTADVEYQDPVEFFARTYLTEGVRRLLTQVLSHICGKGGEPVIQLKMAFGGGKPTRCWRSTTCCAAGRRSKMCPTLPVS